MTIAEIQAMRDSALSAYKNALKAQSINKDGRGITMQNLSSLRAELDRWDRKLASAKRKSRPFSLVKFTGE